MRSITLIVIVVAVVVAVVVVVAYVLNRRSTRAKTPDAGPDEVVLRPVVAKFHVEHNEARVYFDVPVPESGPDPMLTDLLVHHAIELVRDKRDRGLPLEGIDQLRVYGKTGDASVEVGTAFIGEPDVLPEVDMPALLPHVVHHGYDPLEDIGDAELQHAPSLADEAGGDDLPPLSSELQLTAGIDAGLRAQGIDPQHLHASDLARGLLTMAGYTLTETQHPNAMIARGPGGTTYVEVHDHVPGDYTELSEKAMDEFAIRFVASRAARGLLITDKYGPFAVYERERREPRCRFITRERMQAFVDSMAVGGPAGPGSVGPDRA